MTNVTPNSKLYTPAVEWAMEVLGPEAIITEVSTFVEGGVGEECILVTGLVGTSHEEVAFTVSELVEHIEKEEGVVEDGGTIILVNVK